MGKVAFIPIEAEDDFGLPCLGCDIRVTDDSATVADMLTALDEFAAAHLADCRGCDGCCKERAPWIAADIPALAELAEGSGYPAHRAIAAFGELTVDRHGATDICFRRDKSDGACCMLDKKGRFCTHHPSRAFVCRTHFCIPRSEDFSRVREEIVNAGENELTRILLAEEAAGAPGLTRRPLAKLVNAADYPAGAHSGKSSYAQLVLKDILSPELWQSIKKEE